jgi:hypothetical protein
MAMGSSAGVSTMIDITSPIHEPVSAFGMAEALEAVERLRDAIARLDLAGGAASRAGWAVDDMQDELRRSDPDRDVMASRLWRLTEFLQGEGVAVEAEPSLFDAIAAIAAWVGPLGEALLRRLR